MATKRKSRKRISAALKKYVAGQQKNPVRVPKKKMVIRNASSVTLTPMRNGAVGVRVVRKKRR